MEDLKQGRNISSWENIITFLAVVLWVFIYAEIPGYLKIVSTTGISFDFYVLYIFSVLKLSSFECMLSLFSSSLCMIIAYSKNRSVFCWLSIGLWFSVIAVVVMLFLKRRGITVDPYSLDQ